MTPYHTTSLGQLYLGECREVLAALDPASVHAVVTDPPYGFKFMGKRWDYDVPCVEEWREVLRVLKPGGHLLSFGGSRTYHRMVVNIEDAGFEVRDQIQWLYGSGFPKSVDVSRAIDKAAGADRKVVGKKTGRLAEPVNDIRNGNYGGGATGRGRLDCSAITAPTTAASAAWDGWGTALKPAHEPICVAESP